jgi:hypothetical protein
MLATLIIVKFLIVFSQTSEQLEFEETKEDDYALQSKIVNLHNFSYLMKPTNFSCIKNDIKSENFFLLVYVHSSPSNFKRRLQIRETWARRSLFSDLRLVFMIGKTNSKLDDDLLQLEQSIYNDLVQEDFVDSYRNLTYKAIMAMRWISEYCSNAKVILKVDDDIFVNMFLLIEHVKKMNTYDLIEKRSIFCYVFNYMKPIRLPKSKWFVSHQEYKPDRFHKYCSGSAYLLTGDLPPLIYKSSQYIKFFWIGK